MGSIRENFAENVAFELHHKKQIGFIYEYYYLLYFLLCSLQMASVTLC